MLVLLTRPFDDREARSVAGWRYDGPYALYNVDPDALELFRRRHADGEGYYPAVDENDGTVAAFAV